MVIIDRRANPKGKNIPNRQRFVDKAKASLKEALRKTKTNIKDFDAKSKDDTVEVSINPNSIHEPRFHLDRRTGESVLILPGNKNDDPFGYVEGDIIPKPKRGSGSGDEGSPFGDGVDEFTFVLSNDELNQLFFEDLELPNEDERKLKESDSFSWNRAGYTKDGSPANLSINKTMRNSFGRRIALRRPKQDEIDDLEELLKNDPPNKEEILNQIHALQSRRKIIPYIDTYDVRYNNFIQFPQPKTQSVIFCLMDVSASMTENMKDIAKHFFALLYKFLTTKYKHVDIVFIRHTQEAEEVNEETFFYDPSTGGTLVSSALEKTLEIIKARYNLDEWNIYVAQASDGDNTTSDGPKVQMCMEKLLQMVQYYAYLETERDGLWTRRETDLWEQYKGISNEKFAMKKAKQRSDIFPVFVELFKKKE